MRQIAQIARPAIRAGAANADGEKRAFRLAVRDPRWGPQPSAAITLQDASLLDRAPPAHADLREPLPRALEPIWDHRSKDPDAALPARRAHGSGEPIGRCDRSRDRPATIGAGVANAAGKTRLPPCRSRPALGPQPSAAITLQARFS